MARRWFSMTGWENLPHSSSSGVLLVCSGQSLSKMAQRRRKKVNQWQGQGWPYPGGLGGLSQQTSYVRLNRWRISRYFWYTGVRIHGVLQFVAFFTWRTHITKMYYGMKATWQSVMLCNRFYWETLGSAIHIDVTLTSSANQSMIADHKHSFMDTILPDVFSSNRITHRATKECNKLLTCHHSNHASVGCAGQTCLIDRAQQQHTFRGQVERMPLQVRNPHKIRLVVIMLCLIGVYVLQI